MTVQTAPLLAEGRWLWRRLYVFGLSVGLWALLAHAIHRAGPASLPRIVDGLLTVLALVMTVYLIAPTTQQLITLVARMRLRFGGRP